MPWRPRLWDDIRAQPDGLFDPLVDRQVALGPVAREILARLDGQTAIDALLDETAAAVGSRAAVESSFRSLLLLNVIEGAGGDIRRRLRAIREGAEPSPRHLPEARFGCRGTGDCCRSYALGPLTDADLERLAGLDLAAAGREPPFLEERPAGIYLRRVDGGCVFLLDDRRCGLHARFGEESKPGVCRLYPWQILGTVDGLRVFDHGECCSYPWSAAEGEPLADAWPGVRRLLPTLRLHHPVVLLLDGTACDFGHLLPLSWALVDAVSVDGLDWRARLRLVAHHARRWSEALSRCPLEEGQPDSAVATALSQITGTPPDRETSRETIDGLLAALSELRFLVGVHGTLSPSMSPFGYIPPEVPGELLETTDLLIAILLARQEGKPGPSLPPLGDDPRIEETLRLSLRHALVGDGLHAEDRLGAALLRLALLHAVILVRSSLVAQAAGSATVGLEHLAAGHKLGHRMLRPGSFRSLLQDHAACGAGALEAITQIL